jgi:hypothetical protein
MSDQPETPAKVSMRLVERRPAEKPEWSPIELLEKFIEDIRSGQCQPTALLVHFVEHKDDGTERLRTWSSNCSRAEAIAFSMMMVDQGVREWRTE